MQKQAPSLGRILAMVVFAMSCFGLLLFLWLSFGGPIPLRPQGYRFKASFPEAATLAQEADVRIAGVNVGKVKQKALQKKGRTLVTIELDHKYAPIPKDTRATLRQKTLLGETYVELSAGTRRKNNMLGDGATLSDARVADTQQLDEIFAAFDEPTRRAFQAWVKGSADTIKNGRGQDLNDALGNLEGFAVNGAGVLRVLDQQELAVQRLVKNTGVVFHALNERQGELADLIVNSNNVFSTTAQNKEALSEIFLIFPTFLRESRFTFNRLARFARNTDPLIRDLKPVADDLGPTFHDLALLAPDLKRLFIRLDPLITAGNKYLPDLVRILRGVEPVFKGIHAFFPEINPIIAFAQYEQETLTGFFSNGGSATNYRLPDTVSGTGHVLSQYGIINDRVLGLAQTRPDYDRGNAYLAPNAYTRALRLGNIEVFNDCNHQPDANIRRNGSPGGGPPGSPSEQPPCFVAPASIFQGQKFPRLTKGKAPLINPPRGQEGTDADVPSF
jgi:phospholipid/cholesterol/gamma-HCH transport system substrate-binding protein